MGRNAQIWRLSEHIFQGPLWCSPPPLRPPTEPHQRERPHLCVPYLYITCLILWNVRLSQWCCWRFQCSGMLCSVVGWVVPDVGEDFSFLVFCGMQSGKNSQILDRIFVGDKDVTIIGNVGNRTQWHNIASQKNGIFTFNPLTPNDLYISRTTPLTFKRCILYIYSTNVGTECFKHAVYSPFFFSSKCSLFHNANFFGSSIIHILYIGCAEIKKNNSGAKGLTLYATVRNSSIFEVLN